MKHPVSIAPNVLSLQIAVIRKYMDEYSTYDDDPSLLRTVLTIAYRILAMLERSPVGVISAQQRSRHDRYRAFVLHVDALLFRNLARRIEKALKAPYPGDIVEGMEHAAMNGFCTMLRELANAAEENGTFTIKRHTHSELFGEAVAGVIWDALEYDADDLSRAAIQVLRDNACGEGVMGSARTLYEVAHYGCATGCLSGMIMYSETGEFYEQHKSELYPRYRHDDYSDFMSGEDEDEDRAIWRNAVVWSFFDDVANAVHDDFNEEVQELEDYALEAKYVHERASGEERRILRAGSAVSFDYE